MVILLDIDGVMVKAVSWKAPELLPDGFPAFGDLAVAALNRILAVTAATIVLTTSHKHLFSLEAWQALFQTRGIVAAIGRLEDNSSHLSRKAEIERWLNSNDPQHFVILDDDSSINDLSALRKAHWVATSPMIGLTTEQASRAIAILNAIE